MSVKKLITFATAGIASVGVTSAAVAGGPDYGYPLTDTVAVFTALRRWKDEF